MSVPASLRDQFETAADAVRLWNLAAQEANRLDHSAVGRAEQAGPTLSSRAIAIVHLAMHDAWFGAKGGAPYGLYLPAPFAPAAPPVDPSVAVGAAAASALRRLYRGDAVNAVIALAETVARKRWPAQPAAEAYGVSATEALFAHRGADVPATAMYMPDPTVRHDHREDPENVGQGYHGVSYGGTKPFAVSTAIAALANPPTPEYQSLVYDAALASVRAKGGAPGLPMTSRSTDETVRAVFWAYDGVEGLGTPPRLYNRVVLVVADNLKLGLDDVMRLLALANAAMGDAGIYAWHEKYKHRLWRPVVGIREDYERDVDGRPVAVGDLQWRPLGAPRTNTDGAPFTPPFPAYPSGHATFGAAAFHVARLFLRGLGTTKFDDGAPDPFGFEFTSEELDGVNKASRTPPRDRARFTRRFQSLWEAIRENAESRVFLGVHWIFDGFGAADYGDGLGGVPLGLAIAKSIFDGDLKASTQPPPSAAPAMTLGATRSGRAGGGGPTKPRRRTKG